MRINIEIDKDDLLESIYRYVDLYDVLEFFVYNNKKDEVINAILRSGISERDLLPAMDKDEIQEFIDENH